MRRIYFLLPSLEDAREMVQEFRNSGTDDDHLHLVAKREAGMEDLPEASVAESTDVVPALKRGVIIGAVIGLIAGLVAALVLPVGVPGGMAVVVGVGIIGAVIAAWSGALSGAGMDREPIAGAEDALEEGAVVMMVDVPDDEADAAKQRVLKRHPEVRIEDTEHLTTGVSS